MKRSIHGRLRELNNPVLALRASHRGHGAEKASTEEAGSLQRQVHISIKSRVMLLENVWTDHALFNGAVGTVRNIFWDVWSRSEH
jgi:ATP-dependent DNA helicase PIF1